MRSMTGYGRGSAEAAEQGLSIEVEIATVNRKALDFQVSTPRDWNGLEQAVGEWLAGRFQRGRIQVQIKASSGGESGSSLAWNESAIDESLARLRSFAEARDIPFAVDSRLLFEIARTLKDSGGLPDWRELEAILKTATLKAADEVDAMRLKEGEALAADLRKRIEALALIRKTIAGHAKDTTARYRDALLERLKQLGLDLDLSDERVLREIALFADRSDISEELTRMESHFEQFLGFLESEEAVGRKMDFLCQEIHREFNTTGSKANQIEITRAVIEGKNALEQIREQVQNIE